jgi:hypothetical protein
MTGPHLIGTVTVILSFLAGMAFGVLLYFRHRRTGIVGLAATCAGMALIVVVTETAGGSTIGHALKMAAFFGLFSPMLGAVLACIIIVIVRFLCRITRRALEAVRTFIANVLTDVCRIVTRRGPRTLSNASFRTLAFLVFTVFIYVYLNIPAIWDFAERVLPRISVITNVLDLLRLLLATPKFSTMETRENVRGFSILTLRLFTFKFEIPHSALAYVFGGAIIVSMPLLLLLALSISQSYGNAQFIMLFKEVDTIFPNPVFDCIL